MSYSTDRQLKALRNIIRETDVREKEPLLGIAVGTALAGVFGVASVLEQHLKDCRPAPVVEHWVPSENVMIRLRRWIDRDVRGCEYAELNGAVKALLREIDRAEHP